MSVQSGVTVQGIGQPFVVAHDIAAPTPGPKQALVKSLVVSLNPVELFQQQSGLLVNEWPAVLGSDFCGVVTDIGEGCTRLKKGDYVLGCAFIGQNKYTPFQDTFLVDEDVVLKKSANLSVEEASTIGVGLLTASLGVLEGTGLTLPPPETEAPKLDEWVIVLGGSGSVGQLAIQLARLSGYKVLASCSSSKANVPINQGATATFNGRASIDVQVAEIKKITGGNYARIFDASAHGYALAIKALETCSSKEIKYFASVDDWSPFDTPASIKEYRVLLGHIGRYDEDAGAAVSKKIAELVPLLESHLEAGTIKGVEYSMPDGVGWDKVVGGIGELAGGALSKKLVVRVQNE